HRNAWLGLGFQEASVIPIRSHTNQLNLQDYHSQPACWNIQQNQINIGGLKGNWYLEKVISKMKITSIIT
ncbi:MAG: hypothetical protein ACO3GX_11575, partial [Gemmataceae bacterium]